MYQKDSENNRKGRKILEQSGEIRKITKKNYKISRKIEEKTKKYLRETQITTRDPIKEFSFHSSFFLIKN